MVSVPEGPWGWHIYLHEWLISMGNVSKYTSPMDPMGVEENLHLCRCFCGKRGEKKLSQAWTLKLAYEGRKMGRRCFFDFFCETTRSERNDEFQDETEGMGFGVGSNLRFRLRGQPSLKLTSHLKMDGWKMSFLFGRPPETVIHVIQSDLLFPDCWRSPTTFEFGSRKLTIPRRSPAELPGWFYFHNFGGHSGKVT